MNANIELTFRFRAGDDGTDGLPLFADEGDVHFLLWIESGLVPWLRELAAHLPDRTPVNGKDLVDRFPVHSRNNTPDFLHRLGTIRLKRLFFGDAPRSGFQLANVTIRRAGPTLTCRYVTQ